jgi:hypothetical protein
MLLLGIGGTEIRRLKPGKITGKNITKEWLKYARNPISSISKKGARRAENMQRKIAIFSLLMGRIDGHESKQ